MGLISRVSVELTDFKQPKTQNKHHNMAGAKENQGFNARKCSASGKLIAAKDHGAIQLNIAEVDDSGRITGNNITYAICGDLRKMGESDDAINRLARAEGIVKAGVF